MNRKAWFSVFVKGSDACMFWGKTTESNALQIAESLVESEHEVKVFKGFDLGKLHATLICENGMVETRMAVR